MQQPQPDQQMQQQIQFTTPQYQQLQQPIMLCPVQYVYEPMISEDQTQPNEPYQNQAYVLNVQNPPPWSQNRPNMLIMQQVPNIQPYIPQQMVQNPMYSYQPMIVQERQLPYNQTMINPQMLQNVMSQQMLSVNQMMQTNQQIINPQMMNVQNQMNQNTIMNPIIQNPVRYQMEKRETPILASMLNVRKPPQSELVSLIRPQYNARPQMIIVNPITKHTCGPTKESPIPIEKQQKTDIQSIRSQVPEGLSVKTIQVPATALIKPNENVFQNVNVPDNVNVRLNTKPKQVYKREPNYKRKIKEFQELNNNSEVPAKINCTVKPDEQIYKVQVPIDTHVTEPLMNINLHTQPTKPFEEKKLRNTVYVQARGRVNDVRNETQTKNYTNIYNIATSIENTMMNNKNVESLNKNVVVTTNLDPNSANNEHLLIVTVNNANVLYSNIINPHNKSVETKTDSEINDGNARLEDTTMQTDNIETEINPDNQTISEDTFQNVNETLTEINFTSLKEEVKMTEINGNKHEKVKLPQIISVKNAEVSTDFEIDRHNKPKPTNNVSEASTQNNLPTIKKLLASESKTINSKNTKDDANILTPITTVSQETQSTLEPNDLQTKTTITQISKLRSLEDDTVNKSTMTEMSKMTKIIIPFELNHTKPEVTTNINNGVNDKNKLKLAEDADVKKTEDKVVNKVDKHKNVKKTVDAKVLAKDPIVPYVLTHVLDGHIIQESNVPFEVQKTSILALKEKPISEEDEETPEREETEVDKTEDDIKERETEVSSNSETEDAESEIYNPDKRRDMKTIEVDKDNPFKNLNKDVVGAWTVNEVTSHLMRYACWRDTAMKLVEQEIDGESLLLVRKDQLLTIDICEDQAQEIQDFIDK